MVSLEPLVLIADDEPDITEVLEAYFRRDGFRTVVAADGRAALDLWRKHRPAIAVLDLRMPHMDGLQVLAEIRRVADTPVLILTALGDDLDKLLGLRVGADDYVVKPVSPAEIVARVRAILRRAGPRPAIGETSIELGGLVIDPGAREARGYSRSQGPLGQLQGAEGPRPERRRRVRGAHGVRLSPTWPRCWAGAWWRREGGCHSLPPLSGCSAEIRSLACRHGCPHRYQTRLAARAASDLDMCITCEHAFHMPTMIQIRNVPEALHHLIKSRAALAGMSLSDYLLDEIRQIAERPTLDELRARLERHADINLAVSPADAVRAERDRL